MSRTLRIGAYAAVTLIAAFEVGVLWLALHPDPAPDYRAYYIDHTTTCLNQPVSGLYPLGEVISFRPDGRDAAKPLKVCGWEGPAGDGTHAVGTSSRLRFVSTELPDSPLTLELELVAVKKDGAAPTRQRVDVSVNGERLGEAVVGPERARRVRLALPEAMRLAADGRFEVVLSYPDAVKMGPTDPATRRRSIKLSAAGITKR